MKIVRLYLIGVEGVNLPFEVRQAEIFHLQKEGYVSAMKDKMDGYYATPRAGFPVHRTKQGPCQIMLQAGDWWTRYVIGKVQMNLLGHGGFVEYHELISTVHLNPIIDFQNQEEYHGR